MGDDGAKAFQKGVVETQNLDTVPSVGWISDGLI
jgi:hypothetical protein